MMDAYETVAVERQGPLAVLTLNRPHRLNAVSSTMSRELPEAMTAMIDDPAVRAILLTGAGRGFCAGADLQDMHARRGSGDGSSETAGNLQRFLNPMLVRMVTAPKPIITAVNGPAAGIGCGIALAGDVVLAGRSAQFVQAFVRLGAVPDGGNSWILPRMIGRARATAMMMLGEPVLADQALEWGMVHELHDDDALLPAATALARKFADGPTNAYSSMKAMFAASVGNSLEGQLAMEAECQRRAFQTADFAEGVAAFVQKRPPAFTGH